MTVLALGRLAAKERRRLGKPRLAPILFYGFVAAAAGLFYLDDAMVSSQSGKTVRMLLNLPDDVRIGQVRGGDKNPVCYRKSVRYITTVEFTPDQLERYLATMADPAVWRPAVPPHYISHKSRLEFASDALTWQELPEPGWTGSQQLVWRIAGRDVRRGLALCYALTPADRQEPAAGGPEPKTLSVTPCNARSRIKTPAGGGLVVAALDTDQRRLAVAIDFDSKPDYCNNRVSGALAAALGIDAR